MFAHVSMFFDVTFCSSITHQSPDCSQRTIHPAASGPNSAIGPSFFPHRRTQILLETPRSPPGPRSGACRQVATAKVARRSRHHVPVVVSPGQICTSMSSCNTCCCHVLHRSLSPKLLYLHLPFMYTPKKPTHSGEASPSHGIRRTDLHQT